MSIKTTITISRDDAVKEIAAHLHFASNAEIANTLEEVLGEKARFYNFIVTHERPTADQSPLYTQGMFRLEPA